MKHTVSRHGMRSTVDFLPVLVLELLLLGEMTFVLPLHTLVISEV